jgi:diguanylate cyclase (GGDEF)-like protein/PAS domain S-box-containing protein
MRQTLIEFLNLNGLIPHGYCLSWSPLLLWLHIGSNVLIALSYYFIPLIIGYFVRQRKTLPYRWLLIVVAIFMVACATTHLISVITIWLPLYWLEAYVKVLTAVASVATAVLILRIVPQALQLPTVEQLQIEIAERKYEEKYHTLYESIQDGIAFINKQGNIIECNQAYMDMLGYSKEELAQLTYQQLTPVKWHGLEADIIEQQVMTNGYSNLYEKEYRRKDGAVFPVELRVWLTKDNQGSIKGMRAIVRDISSRKQVEQALRQSQQKYRLLVNDIGDKFVIYSHNLAGELLYVSEGIRHFVGLAPEAVIGKNWATLINWLPGIIEQAQHYHVQLVERKANFVQYEMSYHRADDSIRILHVSAHAVFDENGSAVSIDGIVEDITERKKTKAELRIAAAIFESQEAILVTDEDCLILRVNKAFTRMTGYNSEDVIGKNPRLLRSNRHDARFYAQLWESINGSGGWEGEIWNRRKNSDIYPSYASITAVKSSTANTHYVATYIDITERKRMEEALKARENLISTTLNSLTTQIAVLNNYGEVVLMNESWQQFAQQHYLLSGNEKKSGWNYVQVLEKSDDEKIAKILRGIDLVLNDILPVFHVEYSLRSSSERWFHMTITALHHEKIAESAIVISQEDITKIRLVERALIASEERSRSIIDASPVPMALNDKHQNITFVNPAFTRTFGYDLNDISTPDNWQSKACSDSNYWQWVADTWQASRHEHASFPPLELVIRCKNGEEKTVLAIAAAISESFDDVHLVVLYDITERKVAEKRIHQLAFYDELTELPNRRLLRERLKHGIEVHHRTSQQMAVLMLDLDKFKAVNDTLGHSAGDELLQQVGKRIKEHLREMDTVARLGGDEFVVLMENVMHQEDIAHVANNIIDALKQPFTLSQQHEVHIGTSIGIALYPQHGDSMEMLMDNADTALYLAKDQGRGCFAYFPG